MKNRLLVTFIFVATFGYSQDKQVLKLWYDKPSGNTWENALPVGNGRLGAMVYGNVEKEIVQLNEHTLWSGSPNRNDNPMALDSLAKIRQLIFEGKQKDAEQLANKVIISKKSQGQMFEPAGELQLVFDGHDGYTNYYRELDIGRAVTKTVYSVGDITYTREVLASLPDRVVVLHLTASKPKSISFTALYAAGMPGELITTNPAQQLTFAGTTIDHEGVKGMVKYKGIVQIVPRRGATSLTDTSVIISNADEVTIYISIATNFNNYNDLSGDENARAAVYLAGAVKKTFPEILKGHTAAYQKYFNRVKLNLGKSSSNAVPTDERLKRFSTTNDPQFAALYFQYGRYLLISASQPGGQAANLQ
ncbi:MAG: glycoside hydrolase family 95 protein, partial [Ferruginibacter sp.]